MRFLTSILLFMLFGSCQKNFYTGRVTLCQGRKQEALEDYKNGIVHFINGEPLRYEQELEKLLLKKGIEYSIDPFGHLYQCYDLVMDSLIKVKFGDDFIDKLKLAADSLFFEIHKNGIFYYYEVDSWALRKGNNDSLGGDFLIDYLNDRLDTKSSFRFVSNTVDRPYYLIEFTVDKYGVTRDIEIKERNNTEEFLGTEDIIINEMSKIKDWTPATIRNQPVTAKFQIGIAIESKQ